MKRPLSGDGFEDRKMKSLKVRDKYEESNDDDDVVDVVSGNTRGNVYLDDNLVFEVLKHVDARSLAMAGCVSKQWHETTRDERLWELICTQQWANTGCGEQQLRSVVLALGGFRRLHSLYLWPLSKPHASSSSWPSIPTVIRSKPRLGKDEMFHKQISHSETQACIGLLLRCLENIWKTLHLYLQFLFTTPSVSPLSRTIPSLPVPPRHSRPTATGSSEATTTTAAEATRTTARI